jgi:hypothetical protein
MRSYWLRILAGAFGIFAVGMVVITGFRSLRTKVTTTLDSSDPIPIPLIGLIPFQLESTRLGRVNRVELLRSDPEHVAGVRVLINLADTVGAERLRSCRLVVDNVDKLGNKTAFRCLVQGGDASGLEEFGTVVIKGSGDAIPLLLPSKVVAELRGTTFRLGKGGLQVERPQDRVAAVLEAKTDSMREALDDRISARSDSADALRERAEALEDSSNTLPARDRRRVQHSADSVRALMRAMVDRMKADEARLEAFRHVSGLSPEQVDSLSSLGPRIADSVRQTVARELQRVQVEIQRAEQERRRAKGAVEAPAPPAPPPAPR